MTFIIQTLYNDDTSHAWGHCDTEEFYSPPQEYKTIHEAREAMQAVLYAAGNEVDRVRKERGAVFVVRDSDSWYAEQKDAVWGLFYY